MKYEALAKNKAGKLVNIATTHANSTAEAWNNLSKFLSAIGQADAEIREMIEPTNNMKHIHAELMMEYAKDAMETAEPWLRWEHYSTSSQCWKPFSFVGPDWNFDSKYRRKQMTININGHEVPEPYRGEMADGERYYVVSLNGESQHADERWYDEYYSNKSMERGLVHLNKEAAIAHTQALLSFTEA